MCFYIFYLSSFFSTCLGTCWYYELRSILAEFDPRAWSVYLLFVYAVLVYYTVRVVKGVREWGFGGGEMRDRLMSDYSDPVSTGHIHQLPAEEAGLYTCSICLEDLLPSDSVRTLGCGHVFHARCVDYWAAGETAVPEL